MNKSLSAKSFSGKSFVSKTLLATVALVALATSSALAADMRLKAVPKVPAVYSWTGFYMGANVGWSFGSENTAWTIAGASAATASGSMNGILGGFQDGWNWQSGFWVMGFETDFQLTSQSGSSAITTATPAAVATSSANLQWLSTIRGRIGVTPAPTWLIYATGGAAFGETQTNENVISGGLLAGSSANTIHSGWTLGGGVETALWDNWTAKLEYLYVDLGHVSYSFTGVGALTPIFTDVHTTDNIIRFGVNYRFTPASSAVMAKY
jgi:outer membrane immunogenic protein